MCIRDRCFAVENRVDSRRLARNPVGALAGWFAGAAIDLDERPALRDRICALCQFLGHRPGSVGGRSRTFDTDTGRGAGFDGARRTDALRQSVSRKIGSGYRRLNPARNGKGLDCLLYTSRCV